MGKPWRHISPTGECAQVAALPYRIGPSGELEVLLITSRETRRWVIPKGWPMAGKRLWEAAAKEARQEAGIRGDVDDVPVGTYHYFKQLEGGGAWPCRVTVYPLRVRAEKKAWREAEERSRQWFVPAVAASLVDEPELCELIYQWAALPR